MFEQEILLSLNSVLLLLFSSTLLGMLGFVWLFNTEIKAIRYMSAQVLLTIVLSLVFIAYREGVLSLTWGRVFMALQMMLGPLLLAYVKVLIQGKALSIRFWVIHSIPSLLMAAIWVLQIQGGLNLSVPCYSGIECAAGFEARFIHRVAVWVSILSYCFVSLKYLKRYHRALQNELSTLEGLTLDWVRALSFLYMGLTLLAMLLDGMKYSGLATVYGGYVVAWGPMFVATFFLVMAIRQREYYVVDLKVLDPHGVTTPLEQENPYDSQTSIIPAENEGFLTQAQGQQIWQLLQTTLEKEPLYLQPGLKLQDLAQALGMSANYVSYALNTVAGKTFYAWINDLRLQHAQGLLQHNGDQSLSMTQISEASGFASQSSFYKHFKEKLGVTPKQYQKSL